MLQYITVFSSGCKFSLLTSMRFTSGTSNRRWDYNHLLSQTLRLYNLVLPSLLLKIYFMSYFNFYPGFYSNTRERSFLKTTKLYSVIENVKGKSSIRVFSNRSKLNLILPLWNWARTEISWNDKITKLKNT